MGVIQSQLHPGHMIIGLVCFLMRMLLEKTGIPDQLADDALLCGVSHDDLCYAIDHFRTFIYLSRQKGTDEYMLKATNSYNVPLTSRVDTDRAEEIIAAFYEMAKCIADIPNWFSQKFASVLFFGAEGHLLIPLFEHISAKPSPGKANSETTGMREKAPLAYRIGKK